METRQDFYVGLLIVVAIALVVGALIATSGWGERRYDLFLRVASADGLSQDTRVVVQGLDVGRIKSISPRVDSATRRISFVARMSIAERFADGSTLQLPAGTRAELVQASQISPAVDVQLILPDTVAGARAYLEAGDTLDSRRRGGALEAVAEVAAGLSKHLQEVLRQTTRTLVRVQATVAQAERTLRDVAPDVESTLGSVATTMGRVDSLVERLHRAGLGDSIAATVAGANRLLGRLDSLASAAQSLTVENRVDLRETVTNLTELSRQLNHFVDELSRRPYRMLTGVKPLPRDTAHRDTTRVSVKPGDTCCCTPRSGSPTRWRRRSRPRRSRRAPCASRATWPWPTTGRRCSCSTGTAGRCSPWT
ncbi:MAG TPA: MlaD family protein [Gemmatimonadales bacterium]|nr:MlaD family protein [Gemmatimonadales bacterium]